MKQRISLMYSDKQSKYIKIALYLDVDSRLVIKSMIHVEKKILGLAKDEVNQWAQM